MPTPPKTRQSTFTRLVTVRILREQAKELDKLKSHTSSSVIVRALLKLWLEGVIDADEAIAEEKARTTNAIAVNRNQNSIAA